MFDTTSLFNATNKPGQMGAVNPLTKAPTDGVQRTPMAPNISGAPPTNPGGFDMTALMQHLQSLYPNSSQASLNNYGQQEVQRSDFNRTSAMPTLPTTVEQAQLTPEQHLAPGQPIPKVAAKAASFYSPFQSGSHYGS